MKNVKFLSILGVFILLTLMISCNLWAAQHQPGSESQKQIQPDKKCVLTLKSISKTLGPPGTVFEMYGFFGIEQGVKMPSINGPGEGTAHALIVISWSNQKLVVKVPSDLTPGAYKVGVYCSNPCAGGAITTYGMVWRDFKVLEKFVKPVESKK